MGSTITIKNKADGKILKVAVIGAGSMGKNHVRIYSEIEGIELVGVADTDPVLLKRINNKYRVAAYTNYLDLIKEQKPDIISLCVPTFLHKKIALDIISEGIHILIEKPIASSVEEANEIINAAKKHKIKLMIGHIERFNPAINLLKEKIQQGELGKVYKVDVNRVGPLPPRVQDIGVVIDLAVHDIDILRYLSDSEPSLIMAQTEQQIHSNAEDLLAGLIRFNNNMIACLNINWLTPTRIRKLYITGEKGMYVVDYIKQNLYFYENAAQDPFQERRFVKSAYVSHIKEGKVVRYKINKAEPLLLELEHFIKCVRENLEPRVTGEDGKHAISIARNLIESGREHKVIYFDN